MVASMSSGALPHAKTFCTTFKCPMSRLPPLPLDELMRRAANIEVVCLLQQEDRNFAMASLVVEHTKDGSGKWMKRAAKKVRDAFKLPKDVETLRIHLQTLWKRYGRYGAKHLAAGASSAVAAASSSATAAFLSTVVVASPSSAVRWWLPLRILRLLHPRLPQWLPPRRPQWPPQVRRQLLLSGPRWHPQMNMALL